MMSTPNDLARQLAHSTRRLTEAITSVVMSEEPNDWLHQQFAAFRDTLLPTITPARFADMYAQTIVYGLFAARVALADRSSFTRLEAAQALPTTNPFICTLFRQIARGDLDEHLAQLVDDCAYVLQQTTMAEVLRDFGKATCQEDPVVHFYESFLAAYNPTTRERRGVYYTPEPVVSYIVRSVDALIQTCYNKPLGLADDDVLILDPATGTATFLHAVVQHIYTTLHDMGMAHAWNEYVPEQLLPRLRGFELLMAPYTIAHLKLSVLLHQLGYEFGSNEQLGIYLTNALDTLPEERASLPMINTSAESLNCTERTERTDQTTDHRDGHNIPLSGMKPVIVILGNPPYSYESTNTGDWISTLVRDYYQVDGQPLGERNPKGLQDDYVKFMRFAQWHIKQTGEGILAFISNNGYLDNPTFRGMRASLLRDFDTIYILNLHGNSRKKERAPDGSPDENVFDIQQGVAIGLFVKQRTPTERVTVYYADLWGTRARKYAHLLATDVRTIYWQTVYPTTPWYLFVPQDTTHMQEYEQGLPVTDVFPIHNAGIMTARDALTIQFDKARMWDVVTNLVCMVPEEVRRVCSLPDDTRDWNIIRAQADVAMSGPAQEKLQPITYRPFDVRWSYYTGKERGWYSRPRNAVMQHMVSHANLGLITVRQVAEGVFTHVYVTDTLVECRIMLSNKGYGHLFPLYLYPDGQEHSPQFNHWSGRRPNFSDGFIRDVERRLGLSFIPDGVGDMKTTIGPEDLFHYIYAIVHSPTYRTRYAAFLKMDFPRVPLTCDIALFRSLVACGAHLVDLHLLRLPGSSGIGGSGGIAMLRMPELHGVVPHNVTQAVVERVCYNEPQQRVVIGMGRYFEGVDPATWAMQVGGYQPLHKWLKDRKGRRLSSDDVRHYMRMVLALREMRRRMAEIDATIAVWPLE